MRGRHLVASVSVAVALVACAAPSVTPSATVVPSPSPAPSLPATADLVSLLDCDTEPIARSDIRYAFDTEIGGATLQGAVAAWVANNPFGLPHAGYELVDAAEAIYAYRLDGRAKVVVAFSTRNAALLDAPERIVPRYTMDALAFCDRSEVWAVGPAHRVWTNAAGDILNDYVGPEHCQLQLIRMLETPEADGSRFYIRDPVGSLTADSPSGTFASLVSLPRDAVDSGYRSGELALWFSELGDAAYVVGPEGVERWPLLDAQVFCM